MERQGEAADLVSIQRQRWNISGQQQDLGEHMTVPGHLIDQMISVDMKECQLHDSIIPKILLRVQFPFYCLNDHFNWG